MKPFITKHFKDSLLNILVEPCGRSFQLMRHDPRFKYLAHRVGLD
jgi:hypothetical protein